MALDTRSIRAGLRRWTGNLTAAADEAVNEDRIRIAVTGLSRAGKTVFITSLVHNLLALGQGRNTLPRLSKRLTGQGENRLRSVQVVPPGASLLPAFPYENNLARLAATSPAWPAPTADLAQISLRIELARKTPFGQRLGTRRLRLDLLDYPGEWLLDLPMIDQGFAKWSAETLGLLRTPPRDAESSRFRAFLANVRAGHPADEHIARQGHALYCEALQACRQHYGLRYLQPGRFVCPGPRADAPFMQFFPIEMPPGGVAEGTLGALLRDCYDAYCRDVRTNFFDTHFSQFDRQVVLVDVLGTLAAGRPAFEDTRKAVSGIAHSLRYGSRPGIARHVAAGVIRSTQALAMPSFTGRLAEETAQRFDGRRIERVVFAATKADHVPAMRRDNLRNLLQDMAGAAHLPATGAPAGFRTVASLLATQDDTVIRNGRTHEVVLGKVPGEDRLRPYSVGDIPSAIPGENFWSGRYMELPNFLPPSLGPAHGEGLPHLGLDDVVDDLIGEVL